MNRFLQLSAIGLLAIALGACEGPVSQDPVPPPAASSSVAAQRATAEGVVEKLGVNMFMQGTHRLATGGALPVLLQSSSTNLDAYLDMSVRVTGMAVPTVEGQGILIMVDSIVPLDPGAIPPLLPMSSSESSSSSSLPLSTSSSSSSSYFSSSSVAPSSSSSSVLPLSSSSSRSSFISSTSSLSSVASSFSSSSTATDQSANVKAMAKAGASSDTFTQMYCSSHIGFCIPLHKSWYYQSFGANISPFLWHVEVSNAAVENEGDGVLMINLVSGALLPDQAEGAATRSGDFVTAYRQWTGNRHFEISAPVDLQAAVEHMALNIVVYQADGQ